MLQKGQSAGFSDSQIRTIVARSLGEHFQSFRTRGAAEDLPRLELYESILYSLDKQDLVHMLRTMEILSTTMSPRLALHALLKKATEILDVSRGSLIFPDSDRELGTVAISHEDPDFEGVTISLESYPEILHSLQTGTITVVKNPVQDPLMYSLKEDQLCRIQDVSIMALPLVFQRKAFGVLLFQKQRSEEGFNIREVRISQLALGMVLRALQRICEEKPLRTKEKSRVGETSATTRLEDSSGMWGDTILFSGAPIGIFLLDGQERVVRANPVAGEITGIPYDGLVGRRFDEIVPRERIDEIRRMRKDYRGEGNEPLKYHLVVGPSDGSTRTLSFEKHPIAERAGHAWIFFRDVTKEKQLEEHLKGKTHQLTLANQSLQEARASLLQRNEELQRTNERLEELLKMKTAFLAIATHEIRTPLSIVLGYDRMLLQEKSGPLNHEQKRILEESVQSCERLLNIVNEMLDFTKLESGKLMLHKREDDILSLLKRVYRQMKMISDRAGIQLELDLPDGRFRMPYDPDRIEQVLVNLISNAIKFTPPKGTITLSACKREGPEEGWFEIAVCDTGKGLSTKRVEKVFDGLYPFPRATKELRPSRGTGTGLGLGICRRIVEAHGGRIEARSKEGHGSTFVFSLPLSVQKAADEGERIHKDPPE